MQSNALASVEISIALVSWINDQLRETAIQKEEQHLQRHAYWVQQGVTLLAVSLSGLCVMVLQRWT